MSDTRRRVERTAAQFILGDLFTLLVNQLVYDIPDRYDAYVVLAAMLVATYVHNLAEDRGYAVPLARYPQEDH